MSETASGNVESRGPFLMALVLACATFPLIWVGGMVTTYDAGMAVPDWPSTYGYNLFLYPWETWLFGPFDLFIEHGHRLLGAVVGMLTIGLLAVVWMRDSRPWMRVIAVAALVGVISQGVLGGMRVRMDARHLAMLHGCFGPAFFAFTAVIALFASRWWRTAAVDAASARVRVQPLALMVLVLAYGQLVVGALLRHTPVDASYGFFRGAVVFHLLIAGALAGHVVWLARVVRRGLADSRLLGRFSLGLVGLVVVQIGLGAGTWVLKYGWPAWAARWAWNADYVVATNTLVQSWTVTAHVANGSLILAFAAVTFAGVCRRCGLGVVGEERRTVREERTGGKSDAGDVAGRRAPSRLATGGAA